MPVRGRGAVTGAVTVAVGVPLCRDPRGLAGGLVCLAQGQQFGRCQAGRAIPPRVGADLAKLAPALARFGIEEVTVF